MNKLLNYIILLLLKLCLSVTISLSAQAVPEILSISVDPVSDSTTVVFRGIDHPEVDHYIVLYWSPNTQGNSISAGIKIPDSRIEDNGIPASEYSTSFYLEEVTESAIGFTVDAFTPNDLPLEPNLTTDTTVYLEYTYDSCLATVELQWNDYNAWRGQIDSYELYVIVNSTTSSLGALPEGINDTLLTNLLPGYYNFYIEVSGLGRKVTSNGAKVNAMHTSYPEYVYANYGTVNAGNRPEVLFTIDPNSGLDSCILLRSNDPAGPFDSITSIVAQNSQIAYTDEAVDASLQPYYYSLQVKNNCGNVIGTSENTAGTIRLTAELSDEQVHLEWNAYQNWFNGVHEYTVQRSFDGSSYSDIGTGTTLNFTDENFTSLARQEFSNEVCYRVVARPTPNDSLIAGASSTSNLYCFELPASVHFDFDAFVPGQDGFSTFGPTIDTPPVTFVFKIFNRNGIVVFETNDANNPRWDGRYQGGDLVPQGVYRYSVVYKNPDGRQHSIQGKVTVVRQ